MIDRDQGVLGRPQVNAEDVRDAMGHAIADALRGHKGAGRSVVTWDREQDQVVVVPTESITIPEETVLVGSSRGATDNSH
jgi:hypothetical protein